MKIRDLMEAQKKPTCGTKSGGDSQDTSSCGAKQPRIGPCHACGAMGHLAHQCGKKGRAAPCESTTKANVNIVVSGETATLTSKKEACGGIEMSATGSRGGCCIG